MSRSESGNSGFTLIEVIVSVMILAMGIATFAQLVSGGLHSTRLSRNYTTAATLAKSKLSGILTEVPLKETLEKGSLFEDERFTWEREVNLHVQKEQSAIYNITVKVFFPDVEGGNKEVTLSTRVTRVSNEKNGPTGN
ncbi:MAG: prepilin-type N-terminal cleavage/methylation domain-containing protein [Nitrospinota bacterium]